MATENVGAYRKYHGAIPVDKSGTPMPKSEWPRLRPHSWVVQWFGSDGRRFSTSFGSRKEAEKHAEKKQAEIRKGSSAIRGNHVVCNLLEVVWTSIYNSARLGSQ